MSEWKQYKIKDVVQFHRGITWSKFQEATEPKPSTIPVLRISNIQQKLNTDNLIWLNNIAPDSIKKYAAYQNWILMVGSNGNPERVGNCVLIKESNEFLFASFLVGIESIARAKVIPEYFFFLLRGSELQKFITDDVQGSTGLRNINLGRLREKIVKCPSVLHQRRIAEILSTVDEAIEQTEALIAKYQQIKSGLMQDLFTRGVMPDGKLRPPQTEAPHLYKESPLGWIPKEWKVEILETLTDYVDYRGKTPPKSDYGVFLITAKNIKEGYIDYEISKEYIPEKVFDSAMSRGRALIGDVIITTEAPIGNVAQIDREDVALAQRVIKYRGKQNRLINSYLALYLMSFRFQKQLVAESTGSTVLGIKGSRLHKIPICLPSINEQNVISGKIESLNKIIHEEYSSLSKRTELKQGLMNDLLTGKVRVNVEEN